MLNNPLTLLFGLCFACLDSEQKAEEFRISRILEAQRAFDRLNDKHVEQVRRFLEDQIRTRNFTNIKVQSRIAQLAQQQSNRSEGQQLDLSQTQDNETQNIVSILSNPSQLNENVSRTSMVSVSVDRGVSYAQAQQRLATALSENPSDSSGFYKARYAMFGRQGGYSGSQSNE